jgi:hypothetical protein
MTMPGPASVPPLADADLLAGALRAFGPHPLDLAFVVDEGPTMPVWGPTVRAFRDVLESVFAEVRQYSLQSFREGTVPPSAPQGRLVLVLTDGLDDFWGGRSAALLLRAWGRAAPVAIINPYPEDRWYRSHLGPRLLQVAGTRALAPNAALRVQELDRWRDPFEPEHNDSAVVVPLLELSPRWLRWWSGLVGEPTGDWLDAVVYVADPERPPSPPVPAGPATPGAAWVAAA